MKKFLAIFGVLFLLCALCTAPAFAGKPVDGDNDGYKNNVDCNDGDASINPGAAEVCFDGVDNNCDGVIDEGCTPGTCTDNDADGYGDPASADCTYPDLDCDDVLAAVNPGASENCSNGIDDDCNGLIDAADPACGTNPHAGNSWNNYPADCMGCHNTQFSEMANSTHYKWVGETTEMTNQNGTLQGKLTNAVNSYCINILGDWKICGKCHAGRGLRPDDQAAGLSNIDCLACHNEDYALTRTRISTGVMAPAIAEAPISPANLAILDGYTQNLAAPKTGACLKCHANAGGGDAVKRGDLSMATITNTNADFDVHMNTTTSDVQCQECHVFQNHKTIGRGSDLRPTDDVARGSEVKCYTCHTGFEAGTGHANAGANRSEGDRHVFRVACQSCHVDEFAKVATEMHRDWRFHHDGSPADGVSGPGHPHVEKAANLQPEFKFWNRTSNNYLMGDTAVIDPATGFYPTSRPLGNLNDGKLYPFKYKTADQPMVSSTGELLMLDTLVYIGQTGDVVQAIESGLANMGYPSNEPYEWVTTDTYQLLNHGVAPAGRVDCQKCHNNSEWGIETTSMLDAQGYALKGAKSQVCSQCHSEKNLKRDHFQMHNHVSKGAGMDCLFCHSFTRQAEKGGIGPCDPNASDFVDNIPFNHPECN
ncbi:MAG: MopE-related protein [Desulfuromonadales bacterium]|nr:MopE-related protein [Desulfuromonadales bacterium]